jgi:hypothetical protein
VAAAVATVVEVGGHCWLGRVRTRGWRILVIQSIAEQLAYSLCCRGFDTNTNLSNVECVRWVLVLLIDNIRVLSVLARVYVYLIKKRTTRK